jgi:hypothetical protein
MYGPSLAQNSTIPKLDQAKVEPLLPFVISIYGGDAAFNDWKKDHPEEYQKFMWYMTESYELRRNYYNEGYTLDGVIDVRRYEHLRKKDEAFVVTFPHFRDAIVLLPESKLLYKP